MHGVLICTGYSLASWIGVGFYFVKANGSQWRVPLAIQCVPPLLLAAGVMFLPESPRWRKSAIEFLTWREIRKLTKPCQSWTMSVLKRRLLHSRPLVPRPRTPTMQPPLSTNSIICTPN